MKIVLAPNAFKGSLSAAAAAAAMAAGVRAALPTAETVAVPVADGGDGLVQIALANLGGSKRLAPIHDPLGRPMEAPFVWLPERAAAVIELASASGLALLAEAERDPMRTSTFGTGEQIRAALELGARQIYLGIGGSATNDGAGGIAAALGCRFLDAHNNEVKPAGGRLGEIRRIDLSAAHPGLANCRITVICDVDNPLLGPAGAARVYAPQKGAGPEQVAELEAGLANLAAVIRRDCGREVETLPGGGAAGGAGAGLYGIFGAELRRGIDTVLQLVDFEGKLAGADLVLTTEGRLDGQTAAGKAPAGVAAAAKRHGIPCFAIAGGYQDNLDRLHAAGLTAVFSICPGPVPLATAMDNAAAYLQAATEQLVRAAAAMRR